MTFPWAGISSADASGSDGAPALGIAAVPAGRRPGSFSSLPKTRKPRRPGPRTLRRAVSLCVAAFWIASTALLAAGGCSSSRLGYVFSSASWPTEGGDFCRTGSLGAEAHPPFVLRWTSDAGLAPVGNLAALEDAVAGSFLRRTVAVYALDSGKTLWKRNLRTDIASGPTIAEGKLFVSTDIPEGKTYCLNLEDGKALWSADTGEVIGAPSAVPPSVFICTRSGRLMRLAMADGSVEWSARFAQLAACSPGIGEETAVSTTLGDTVVAFSPSTGRVLWRYDAGGAQFGSPALCEGFCVFSTNEGEAVCLDLDTGAQVWKKKLGGRCMSSPAIGDGLAYFTDMGGRLSCFALSTGETVWHKTLDSPMKASPTVSSLFVYTASLGGRVSCFDRRDGELLWSRDLEETLETPAVLAEMFLIVVSAKGKIYCFMEDLG